MSFRLADSGNVLDGRRFGYVDDDFLERDRAQPSPHELEQLLRSKQELCTVRPAETLVADAERLVDERAAGIHDRHKVIEDRTVEVVGDHYRAEPSVEERERAAVLEVDLDDLELWMCSQVFDSRDISIDGDDVVTSRQEEARMTTTPARDIEHGSRRRHERRETRHPGRRIVHDLINAFAGGRLLEHVVERDDGD
jgi:hypothetical protein